MFRGVVLGDSSIVNGTDDGDQARECWKECGVLDSVVSDALAHIRETGGVLNEAALHPGVLHLQLEGGYHIETTLGSRQGCMFGAIIFTLMYCRALDFRSALTNSSTILMQRRGATWSAEVMARLS